MSHPLRVDLSDEVYDRLRRLADETGQAPAELAAEWLRKQAAAVTATGSEPTDAAWEELLRFAGAASLGRATGADNEGIDRDLAAESSGDTTG